MGGARSARAPGVRRRDRRRSCRRRLRLARPRRPGRGTRRTADDVQPARSRHGVTRGDPMRVVVADDAVILREGLARLLEEAGFDVVGLAADADELCALVAHSTPDVAIVDIRMPPTHTDEGLRAAKLI